MPAHHIPAHMSHRNGKSGAAREGMFPSFTRYAAVLIGVLASSPLQAAAPKITDDMMGPMGFYAELQTWPPPPKEFITVTHVPEGSLASGKLKPGDVIVGFGNEKIKGYPQPCITKAIDDAETEAAGGKLSLMLQSGGNVVIEIPVVGTYSATAPYNCPKSDKIIAQTAELILKTGKIGQNSTRTDLLGLMATGEKKYLDVAAKAIKEDGMLKLTQADVDGLISGEGKDMGYVGWLWGYNLITLGEYYLLTKDQEVLPAIRIHALGLARGQDVSGCWGHRMASAKYGGRLTGYAQMNQPSISNFMALIIARKCGIKDPVLDQAIERSNAYVADHVNKGGFPYGVGGPDVGSFNNNGMSGSAAICMSLMGNQHGAQYYSQLAATSYDSLESGHANSFFNPLWTPLGAGLSGPEVTSQFFRKSLWYFNARRHWQGGFPGANGTGGVHSGQALLMYCLPRKVLLITGREADPSIWVKGEAANEVIMRSKFVDGTKSTDELIKLLDDPFPQVSVMVARELAKRWKKEVQLNQQEEAKLKKANKEFIPKGSDITPGILAVIKSGSERARAHAVACFGGECPSAVALPQAGLLGSIVRDKKEALQVRIAAAAALGSKPFQEAKAGHPYYNDVVQLVYEPRTEKDPFNLIDVNIAEALDGICAEPLKENVVTDKALFYKTAERFLNHKRQKGRSVGASMLRGIPKDDFHLVADKLMYVIGNTDPTYQSYHSVHTVIAPGVEVLAGLSIKEGLDLLVESAVEEQGKAGFKAKMVFAALPLYGANAKPYITRLKEDKLFANVEKSRFKGSWDAMLKTIEADTHPKKLISLEEAKRAGVVK